MSEAATERDPALQGLIDEAAIRQLLTRYSRALDRQDHDLLLSLFWPGAIDLHGIYNGPIEGFVDLMRDHGAPDRCWTHHLGTQTIEIDGLVARAETYCLAFYRLPGQPDREIFLRCRYLDQVEKRDGEWRIAHRRVVYGPAQILRIEEEFGFPGNLHEAPRPHDPLYRDAE